MVARPVVAHGYGIGYQLHEDVIPINITSFRRNSETSSAQMKDAVHSSLLQIRDVMQVA